MSRMSRSIRLPRWSAAAALAVLVAGGLSAAIYLAFLNHRLTRELMNGRWRQPTLIVSTARGGSVVATLYGVDWRVTPLVSLRELPPYVGNALLAAEDVRFRH